MKRMLINLSLAALLFSFGVSVVRAQSVTDKSAAAEITAVREKLAAAIKKRDRQTLENIYADDFTHTHASGQVDDKTKRLDALTSGDTTIESAAVGELNICIYGVTTAVAVGQSTIENVRYRWTIVYVKTKSRWQIAASQATRLAEK